MLNVLSKFTSHYRAVLSRSYELGMKSGSGVITSAELLKALLEQKGSVGCEILLKTKKATEEGAPVAVIDRPAISSSVTVSPEVASVIEKSVLIAAQWEHQYVGTEHLLASLYEVLGSRMNALLEGVKFDLEVLKTFVSQVLKGVSKYSDDVMEEFDNDDAVKAKETKRSVRRRKTKTEALDYFGIDLTSTYVEKELDPVVGRESEINRIIQILGRRTKNNPVLIGDPGVGKTAIVEGLAKRIAAGDVPDKLLNKKIYQLDLTLMVAGSMYRGEFEQRLKQTLDEVKANPDIIMFIDEIHTIAGAGAVGGSMDASNILKPALARGQIRCIGATTFEEYKRYIESDSALERRFQPIHVQELGIDQAIEALKGIRRCYEQHHGITIGDDAIEAAVRLSVRYMPEKRLPDKAIDVIDEASSRCALLFGQDTRLREIRECERKLLEVRGKKHDAVKKEQFPLALELKRQEEALLARQMCLQAEIDRDGSVRQRRSLSSADVVAVISEMTKIPVGELQAEEQVKFEHALDLLEQEIFGQSDALSDIVGFVKRARAGLSGHERPLGSFLFLGPSGVGKTETARVLAKTIFGSVDRLIRVDMSEFGEAFTVSRLIGSPAGYVGYREGGMLTEAVRRNPYSVILFDEIEKAHPDVFNVLLQVFDAGHLTDAAGKKVNFKNTIIIMTSNLGMKALNESAKIGFTAESVNGGMETLEASFKEQKEDAIAAVKKFFRPEFLNRLDKIVVFRPLTQSALLKIAEKELNKVSESLKDQKIGFVWSPDVVEFLASGLDPVEGGRMVVRNVHEKLENELADLIIAGTLKSGSVVSLEVQDGGIAFTVSKPGSKIKQSRKSRVLRAKEKIAVGDAERATGSSSISA